MTSKIDISACGSRMVEFKSRIWSCLSPLLQVIIHHWIQVIATTWRMKLDTLGWFQCVLFSLVWTVVLVLDSPPYFYIVLSYYRWLLWYTRIQFYHTLLFKSLHCHSSIIHFCGNCLELKTNTLSLSIDTYPRNCLCLTMLQQNFRHHILSCILEE